MKFRRDYVTNSSSSSFITVHISSRKLVEIIQNFQDAIENLGYEVLFYENDNSVQILGEEISGYVPDDLSEVVYNIMMLIDEECAWYIDKADEYEKYDFDADDYENYDLVNELYSRKEEITNDISHVSWESSDVGWGGDSDSRFEQNNYSETDLKQIYENIAEEKNIDVSAITKTDFNLYVCHRTSTESDTYVYDKATNMSNRTHSFILEDF